MRRLAGVGVSCCLLGAAATGLLRPVVLVLELRDTLSRNPSLNGAAAVESIVAAMMQDGVIP